jgi:hypothetical protein
MDGMGWFSLGLFLVSVYVVFFKWIPKIDAEKDAARMSNRLSVEKMVSVSEQIVRDRERARIEQARK